MTTIAYRDGELAADTMTTDGGRPCGYARKIGRVVVNGEPRLYAAAGDTALAQRFRAWCAAGMEGAFPAMAQSGREAEGYVFYPDHSYECYERDLPVSRLATHYPPMSGGRCWAGGSGKGPALGALFAGRGAVDAVLIAISLDGHTGGAVDVVWFLGKEEP